MGKILEIYMVKRERERSGQVELLTHLYNVKQTGMAGRMHSQSTNEFPNCFMTTTLFLFIVFASRSCLIVPMEGFEREIEKF